MSRYVQVATPALTDLEQVAAGLEAMGLTVERGTRGPLMLEGSLECAGEPVDLRLAAGTLDTVEDFGFVRGDRGTGALVLVCGELDRGLLATRLLGPLRAAVGALQMQRAAAAAGLVLEDSVAAKDGARRLVLRRRGPDER